MMRALTVRQPHAACIAHWDKRIENRSRPLPAKYIGVDVALHAGLGFDDVEFPAGGPDLSRHVQTRGAVIAVVRFKATIGWWPGRPVPSWPQDRWARGPELWLIDSVVIIAEPVPCRGALGLWKLPDDVEQRVRAQLGEVQRHG